MLTYSDGIRWHLLIIIADGSSHFKVRRVFFEQGMLEVGLLLGIIAVCDFVGGILVWI